MFATHGNTAKNDCIFFTYMLQHAAGFANTHSNGTKAKEKKGKKSEKGKARTRKYRSFP